MALTDVDWIAFSSVGTEDYASSTQTITITPTYVNLGVHTIWVTYSATEGQTPQYEAITLTVECTVTSFTRPANPTTDLAYTLFAATHEIDLTSSVGEAYVQDPACNYPYSSVVEWTGDNDWIQVDPENSFILLVQSNDETNSGYDIGEHSKTYAMTLAVDLILDDGNNGGQTTFAMDSGDDLISFDITVTNPCWDTTIDAIAFGDNPIVVIDGEVGSTQWTMPAT